MKISVVMCTYNGEKYLEEQLFSLLNQTRRPDEVLIFDDCSSDNTVNVVNKFIDKNNCENWKLIINKENVGWRRNFINGIEQSSGDIVFTCDQDDVWFSNKIEVMSNIMQNNKKIGLLASSYNLLFEPDKKIKYGNDSGELIAYKNIKRILDTGCPGCAQCIRKDFFDNIVKYYTEAFSHDGFFWSCAALLNCVYTIEKPLINYRRHQTNIYTLESSQGKTIDRETRRRRQELQQLDILKEITVALGGGLPLRRTNN